MDKYVNEIQKWQQGMEKDLRKPISWLSLVGLLWLKEGENTIGSSEDNDIVLPEGKATKRVGVVKLEGNSVSIIVENDVEVFCNDVSISTAALKSDADGKPDTLKTGDLTFVVIKRGDQYGLRVWDPGSERRKTFTGRLWFDIDPDWRIIGTFHKYEKPKTVVIPNALGMTEETSCEGFVSFVHEGNEVTLDAMSVGENYVFVVFKDASSGDTTYPPARFIIASRSEDEVIIDFNKAHNPPCAFTDYATCPFPPEQNHLPFSVEVGERYR